LSSDRIQEIRQRAQEIRRREVEKCASDTSGSVGGRIVPPNKLRDIRPVYPEHLRASNVGGRVVLDTIIDANGHVRDMQTVSASHPDMDQAARDAVQQWEFTSTFLNCEPIEVRMRATVEFRAD
jgi:TonB family protein